MEYKIDIVDIDLLKPNPNNARQHTDRDIENLVKSISKFGFKNPIIANKDGTILVGNGRYLACKKLGIKQVPVHYTDMSEEDAKAFAIMDNRSTELSTWNLEYLLPQLEALKLDNMLEYTGFDNVDFDNLKYKIEDYIHDINYINNKQNEDKKTKDNKKSDIVCPYCGGIIKI